MCGQIQATAALTPGKENTVPTEQKAGRTPKPSLEALKNRKLSLPAETERFPYRLTHKPLSVSTFDTHTHTHTKSRQVMSDRHKEIISAKSGQI